MCCLQEMQFRYKDKKKKTENEGKQRGSPCKKEKTNKQTNQKKKTQKPGCKNLHQTDNKTSPEEWSKMVKE